MSDRSRPRRVFRRRGEIEVEPLLLGEADELPVIGEHAMIAVAEMLEDHLAGLAETGRHLEEIDQVLGRQPAREGFAGCGQGGENSEWPAPGQPDRRCNYGRSVAQRRLAGIGKDGIKIDRSDRCS